MSQQIEAMILAGGLARRMGGEDKGLIELLDKPMIVHVIDRLRNQVNKIRINANKNQERYAAFGFEVFADQLQGFLGPLAGIYSGLAECQTELMLVVPCDCPLLPLDLAQRMQQQLLAEDADLAVATDGERDHSVVLLLKPKLRQSLKTYLESGQRRVESWFEDFKVARVSFADQPNAFVNVNTQEQKQQLAAVISKA
ncbi:MULTISPECIES: molybdenum cofactor guanylyltransferase MobA [Shewanella]|jgi:molybdopterin-guanine dinucleotide biosynthesis protein A|uniref:molybdenum cofactor guanylyltransferase MobA n=1 Tax=Shewanella TaxID=22 RepID=UPI001672CC9A|nr:MULTISPECIES: molybdenum cofactor guanylyltransferase MobA [Shewanella]MBO1271105.1 molybdenum cofactor guanylyltransferase [Shewanella sp. 4t3-1-2LB]MCL2906201.1 molybdenum cofactor guanylyltransferase [Shewanella fodinae]GGY99137.1 molybdenum cofactor guanylyltransferase [Shewanella fodinae]